MTRGQRFIEEIRLGVLLGDGATGTELFARGATPERGVERLNLLAPDQVRALHRDYIDAGSRVIETNTFGANRMQLARYGAEEQTRAIILAGVQLAREAAGEDAYVAGSVGPLTDADLDIIDRSTRVAVVSEQIATLLEGGVDLLIFESFLDLDELIGALSIARSLSSVLPVVAQMAFGPDGYTANGEPADEVARRCRDAGADIVGANCGHGVSSVLAAIRRMAECGIPMSAYLNAGFPEQVEGRYLYLADPDYLSRRAAELATAGVRLLGGCCGTNPDTIRAIARALSPDASPHAVTVAVEEPLPPTHRAEIPAPAGPSPLPILVELDPPTHLDLAPLRSAAAALVEAGATAITIADNPLASIRVDTLTVAHLLQEAVAVPVIPHLTGRDRNRIALQSTIMGAYVADIRSLLCITGDPIRFCQEPNTSGVFDVTSVGLVRMVHEFNLSRKAHDVEAAAFSIGVALNPNVRTLAGQIEKLKRKIDAGANFALTQPVFDPPRLWQLQEALADAGIDIPVYVGILPLMSANNAEFLHHEVPGMLIPEAVRAEIARYHSHEDQRAAGIEIAQRLIEQFAPHVHGFYLIAPRNRIAAVLPLIETVKQSVAMQPVPQP